MQPAAAATGGVPLPAGATIVVTYTGTVAWAWLDSLDMSGTSSDGTAYAQSNIVPASGAGGYSSLNTLPYAPHAASGFSGWGAGISN
jgi:hypothetical protein